MMLEARATADGYRLRRQATADRLSARIGCEVTPHPVRDAFEARNPVPGVWLIAASADEILAEVRAYWMAQWLLVLGTLDAGAPGGVPSLPAGPDDPGG